MIGFDFKFESLAGNVEKAAKEAGFRNISHAAASIRKTEIESIKPGDEPSPPGTPPHTKTSVTKSGKVRKGKLPRAIAYFVDPDKQEAIVGPRFSIVGLAGWVHEFGEEYKGEDYPERPFAAPALAGNIDRFAGSFAGSI